MKPGDFFLDRRHFVGFLLPGALWLALYKLACEADIGVWLESASVLKLTLFLAASYVVGYITQSFIFSFLIWARRLLRKWKWLLHMRAKFLPELENDLAIVKSVKDIVDSDPQLIRLESLGVLNEAQLARYCKWYASKDPISQARFSEFEDEINATVGMSFPLMALGVEGAILTYHRLPFALHVGRYFAVFVVIFLMGIYMLYRFLNVWQAEEASWYRAFLMTWPANMEKSLAAPEAIERGTTAE
jgi:hypothetical protein